MPTGVRRCRVELTRPFRPPHDPAEENAAGEEEDKQDPSGIEEILVIIVVLPDVPFDGSREICRARSRTIRADEDPDDESCRDRAIELEWDRGQLDISDAVATLNHLFLGAEPPFANPWRRPHERHVRALRLSGV